MVTIGNQLDAKRGAGSREEGTSAKPRERGDLFDPACPTRHLLDRIGTKWTAMIVKVLADASRQRQPEVRFAQLQRSAPGVSKKMLASTLRSLERDGLVTRRVEADVPPKVHYRLTARGRSLDEPLAALRDWAEANMAAVADHGDRYDADSAERLLSIDAVAR